MKAKRKSKPTQQDKEWQEKVEKRLIAEKVEMGHPKGKERFKEVIKRVRQKPKNS